METGPALVGLTVADPPELWSDLEFTVLDGAAVVGGIRTDLVGDTGKRGVRAWSFAGLTGELPDGGLDGIPTTVVDPPPAPGVDVEHPNGIVAIDHVVLMTPNMKRTIAAFEAAGLELRRVRETDQYGMPAQQAFFRPARSILELIGPKDPTQGDDRPARFYGLAFTSKDLDRTAKVWGDRLHPAKDAVQPGRKIATLDKLAGSTTAIAVMSQ